MNEERYAKLQFVVEGAWGIEVDTHHLSADYDTPKYAPDPKTTKTGHLELCRIEPQSAGLPLFSVRWDRDDDTMDVDLKGDPQLQAAFAKGSPGFKGHKTEKVGDNPRIYKIDIELPTCKVFKGTITLRGLGLGARVQGGLSFKGDVDCKVIKASPRNHGS